MRNNKNRFLLYFLILFFLAGIFSAFSVNAQGTCKPANVVLVIDTSGSMAWAWDGTTKMEGVKNAAKIFTGYFIPDTSSINEEALVNFANSASIRQNWTNSSSTMNNAIEALSPGCCDTGWGTQYIPALNTANGVLAGIPIAETRAIIFLSDGEPGDDKTTIRNTAADIKNGADNKLGTDDDVIIFTIGIGSSIDETLMKDMATAPNYYYKAPSSNDLKKIYEEIFLRLNDKDGDGFYDASCPGGNDWDDTKSCVNPTSTEAVKFGTGIKNPDTWCNSSSSVARIFDLRDPNGNLRADYVCEFKRFIYKCDSTYAGICILGCEDTLDNDQSGQGDLGDEKCPELLAAGLVPCGRRADDPKTPEFENCPCRLCHFLILGDKIIDFALFKIVAPLAVLLIVIGGVMFLTAGGSPEQISSAKKLMTNVAIGILIIFAAWIIVNTIFMFIGVADWTGLRTGWWKINCPVPGICNFQVCKVNGQPNACFLSKELCP